MTGVVDKFSRLAALKPARAGAVGPSALRAPNEEDSLSLVLGAAIATNHFGEHAVLRNWFSTPEFTEPSKVTLELLSRTRDEAFSRRTLAALGDPAKWLFLDTETTGVSGGTGTYAFLIGVAWWDGGGLHVEQFLMRDFAEEHAILHELAARLAERPVLVTFNGKAFDWPLLENRFTMTRTMRVPRLATHLDLLHPARAIWKLRLGSVRLIELERHVLDPARLGWRREDDIASALIPQHYFDYLRGGPAQPLAAVVRHNQLDLRGLAALFGKIDALLSADPGNNQETEGLDLFGLSRFLLRRGDAGRARSTCAQALDVGLSREFRRLARRDLALLAKRQGDHEGAAALWHEATAEDRDDIQACAQLAIYYERRLKDLASALKFAELALAKLRRMRPASRDLLAGARTTRLENTLSNRVTRLEQRLTRANRLLPPLPLERPQRLAGAARSEFRS